MRLRGAHMIPREAAGRTFAAAFFASTFSRCACASSSRCFRLSAFSSSDKTEDCGPCGVRYVRSTDSVARERLRTHAAAVDHCQRRRIEAAGLMTCAELLGGRRTHCCLKRSITMSLSSGSGKSDASRISRGVLPSWSAAIESGRHAATSPRHASTTCCHHWAIRQLTVARALCPAPLCLRPPRAAPSPPEYCHSTLLCGGGSTRPV